MFSCPCRLALTITLLRFHIFFLFSNVPGGRLHMCVCVCGDGADCGLPCAPHLPGMDLPTHLGEDCWLEPRNPSRCNSNLATRRSPLQGNPGEHTTHWAGLKIHPHGPNVTPEVKIHPARSCWLVLPDPTVLSPSAASEGRRVVGGGALPSHSLSSF